MYSLDILASFHTLISAVSVVVCCWHLVGEKMQRGRKLVQIKFPLKLWKCLLIKMQQLARMDVELFIKWERTL